MGKMREYNHEDPFYASTVDALMEFVGIVVENVRLSCPNATTVRLAAGSGSAQASIGIDGLWRYRDTNFDLAITGGSGVKDIYAVAVTDNDFDNTPTPDTDNTEYDFELRAVASGGTPSSVFAYRKIAEVDWDGAAITGLRPLQGAEDSTQPIYPTAPTPGASAAVVRGASGQTADIFAVDSVPGGTRFLKVDAAGVVHSYDDMRAAGDMWVGGELFVVRTNTDEFTVDGKLIATGLDSGGQRGTNFADPTADQDAATRIWVLNLIPDGTPSGPAGGVLSGNYPDPGLASSVAGDGLDISSNVLAVDASVVRVDDAADAAPLAPDDTAAVGSSEDYAREDHVHPRQVNRETKPFLIMGEVKLPSSGNNVVPPFAQSVDTSAGESLALIGLIHHIESGTSVTFDVMRRVWGGAMTDLGGSWSGIVAGTTPTHLDPANVSVADMDEFVIEVTAVSGTPKSLAVTLIFARS